MNLQRIITISLILIMSIGAFGQGRMWLPLLIKSMNEGEMKSLGMKITAEDVYSINEGSLKDAIVHFGGFCTSEIISSNGLLLTNHHCGYSEIQSHSTLENNLLKDGFWAASHADELPNPGLFATFIDRIDDVTEKALAGINDEMTNQEQQSIIDKNLESIKSSYSLKDYQGLIVRPFYHGNQYFAFTTTTYTDVRLVGTPPESIGKFGADTDNWEWPRHTGDFSLFRIYAGPDNMPADYSPENKPYKPKHYLPVSLDGVEEGDFTLVFGFPGRTNQYLPSAAIVQITETLNPAKIAIRESALKILDGHMKADEKVRLQYASKFARIANYWKKWIGESQGLVKSNAIDKKKEFEKTFMEKNSGNPDYQSIIPQFDLLYADIEQDAFVRDYYGEVAGRNIELMSIAGTLNRLKGRYDSNGEAAYNDYLRRVMPYLADFYKNYNADIDKEVFAALMSMFKKNVGDNYMPPSLAMASSFEEVANDIYGKTALTDPKKMIEILDQSPEDAIKTLNDDPLIKLNNEWKAIIDEKVNTPYNKKKSLIDSLQKQYMKGIMETFTKQNFYPDANSTLRITYGQVNGYSPRDAVQYNPVTYLDGVIEKYIPDDYEFDVHPKLIELHAAKDYGQYADTNGKVPVCFLGSNHTTGGNSGSPAIDAHGNLIGLNFDRVWEGTMSDLNYDPEICRNIMVDARFILFIIDKFAGASHLIEEMDLVHPKK